MAFTGLAVICRSKDPQDPQALFISACGLLMFVARVLLDENHRTWGPGHHTWSQVTVSIDGKQDTERMGNSKAASHVTKFLTSWVRQRLAFAP